MLFKKFSKIITLLYDSSSKNLMIWIIWAFLNMTFASLLDIANKKALKDVDEYWIGFFMRALSLILLLPFVLGLGKIIFGMEFVTGGIKFWIPVFFVAITNIIAVICFLHAVKETELSLILPLTVLTPIFLLLLSPIIGEIPSLWGLGGVLLIALGTYVLNIEKLDQGFFRPFKAIAETKGAKLVVISSLIWATNNIVGKIGLLESNALSWSFTTNVVGVLAFIPVIYLKSKIRFKDLSKHFKNIGSVGILRTAMVFSHNMAISSGYVAYVIAIKRLSILFSTILSYFILGDINAKKRAFGCTLMVVGVVLITVF